MNPVSSLPAIVALSVAMATARTISRWVGAPSVQGRFSSIDGLRGYLAFFVFLHHSSIWYFYLRTGRWAVPPSNLYTNFGQGSVALFFMITGFLFFSKLVDGRTKGIDWGRLFVSRFLRLVPLYLFVMLLLFSIVTVVSHGALNEPLPKLLRSVAHWLTFTVDDAPDLNGVAHTSIIVAGVTWSLAYEWFFYCSLPLLALAVGVVPPVPYLLLGAASVFAALMFDPHVFDMHAFLGGIGASLAARSGAFRRFAVGNAATVVALSCMIVATTTFRSAYGFLPLLLLTLAFSIVAGGNSILGVLNRPFSRILGEMAYSIYLLHGILLFTTMTFVIGPTAARELSPAMHWTLIVGLSPVLILASYCTFRFIERPVMQRTNSLTQWVRSLLPVRAHVPAEDHSQGSAFRKPTPPVD